MSFSLKEKIVKAPTRIGPGWDTCTAVGRINGLMLVMVEVDKTPNKFYIESIDLSLRTYVSASGHKSSLLTAHTLSGENFKKV